MRTHPQPISLTRPQRRRKLPQTLRGHPVVGQTAAERALPDAQQRPALRDARAAAHGADDGRIELVVEIDEAGRVAVRGEQEGERGGCKGGEGRGEEVREGGFAGVVREV